MNTAILVQVVFLVGMAIEIKNLPVDQEGSKIKKERVNDERERQLRLLLEKMDEDRGKSGSDAQSEGEATTEDEFDLRKVNKKMSSKQKTKRDKQVESILKHTGSCFHE